MEEEQRNFSQDEIKPESSLKERFTTVTPLSKYLALALFVALPFIGWWVGYTFAPEKVVDVERVVVKEIDEKKAGVIGEPKSSNTLSRNEIVWENCESDEIAKEDYPTDVLDITNWKDCELKNIGISFKYPITLDNVNDYPLSYWGHGIEVELEKPPVWSASSWNTTFGDAISGSIGPSGVDATVWGLYYQPKDDFNLEERIAIIGDQFDDRKEFREQITIDGHQSTLVIVTTDKYSDWVSRGLFIEDGDFVLSISGGGNGDRFAAFEKFYLSIKFIE